MNARGSAGTLHREARRTCESSPSLFAGLVALLAAIAVTGGSTGRATRRRPPAGAAVISLRQHVAWLVGGLLALAVGIALGGGPLADDDDGGGDDRQTATATEKPAPVADAVRVRRRVRG